jgi:hypothetical protein
MKRWGEVQGSSQACYVPSALQADLQRQRRWRPDRVSGSDWQAARGSSDFGRRGGASQRGQTTRADSGSLCAEDGEVWGLGQADGSGRRGDRTGVWSACGQPNCLCSSWTMRPASVPRAKADRQQASVEQKAAVLPCTSRRRSVSLRRCGRPLWTCADAPASSYAMSRSCILGRSGTRRPQDRGGRTAVLQATLIRLPVCIDTGPAALCSLPVGVGVLAHIIRPLADLLSWADARPSGLSPRMHSAPSPLRMPHLHIRVGRVTPSLWCVAQQL